MDVAAVEYPCSSEYPWSSGLENIRIASAYPWTGSGRGVAAVSRGNSPALTMWPQRAQVAIPRHPRRLVVLLALLCAACGEAASAQQLFASQKAALKSIAEEWGSRANTVSWIQRSDCGDMVGIMCEDGYVTSMVVSQQQLWKPIPNAISGLQRLKALTLIDCSLIGSLPSALFTLDYLTDLLLAKNSLSGSIPADISKLTNLESMGIEENSLSGSLPKGISYLKKLNDMRLSSNSLSGSLPSFLGSLTSLAILCLNNNGFTGSVPDSLSQLQRLTRLHLDYNRLEGSIPSHIGNLTELRYLVLGVNDFTGTIPSSLANLKKLEGLMIHDLRVHGLVPPALTSLQKLWYLELSSMYLSGPLARIVTPMTNLVKLLVFSNQFTGDVPIPASKSLEIVNIQSNYFTSAPIRPKNCLAVNLNLSDNCLPTTLCGVNQLQRSNESCAAFCGVGQGGALCSGHGYCFMNDSSSTGECVCEAPYSTRNGPHTCTYTIDPVTASSATSPMAVSGSALRSAGGALLLTPRANGTWGTAFTAVPLPLFSYFNTKATCGYQFAFNASFAFSLHPDSEAGGDGLVFVVAAALPDRLGGVGRRSVGVEFDSVLSVKHSDPNDNHVGVNVGGSPVSLASATAPLILNDVQTKHAWIHYDPTSGGTLRVFLSSDPVQPLTPTLRARVSLCSILQPKASSAAFYVGFTASSTAGAQAHSVLNWTFTADIPLNLRFDPSNLALGFVLDEDSFSSQGFNSAFHYASAGFEPAQDNSPSWLVKSFASWILPQPVWPVKNQKGCGDCWAFAVVAAVEAAYSIASGWSQPPVLSVDHLRLALSSNCDGGSPTKALQFLLNATAQGRGLLEQAADSQGLALKGRLLASTRYYGVRGIERTAFYGWFGLMLAVQRQPVIVHIEASAPSFQDYDGRGKYADEACFSGHLNHVVLVVGYLSSGFDPSNSAMPPPFWIIRNSWGTKWGDQGHMRMDIRSGDGICGINTLPGLFPVIRTIVDPCGFRSFKYPVLGPVFNPCGQYNCSKKGTSNRCKCSDARFAEVKNTDGSYTCAYVDVCGSSSRNPCVVGTCVNDGRGSYSCVCPPGFVQGTTLASTASCAPGDAGGVYRVQQSNVWCADVHPIFALTLDQFVQQNKGISCSKPLRRNSSLLVNSTVELCSVFYTTVQGDTCAGVGRQVQLCGEGALDAACEAAFQALNPAVDCSSLKPSQAVCVERDPSKANLTVVCDQYYRARLNDTCDSIRAMAEPPLSAVDFYRLNPGVNCNQLIPLKKASRPATTFGNEVCIGSVTNFTAGKCSRTSTYTISPGDDCKYIQLKYFYSIKGCYRRMNGYECVDTLRPGVRICTPSAKKARTGSCSI
ncbi:hypothetical protein CLOM_g14372 [Closterium sp. NIES-68]|nr:hypothetical protein CLOM_g14372 [Closterium sp. NIES-68]GJP84239.1 hypothetical protein CLOP_g14324 [Closterium sp. NIES-67]